MNFRDFLSTVAIIPEVFFVRVQQGSQIEIFPRKILGKEKYFFRPSPNPQGVMWGVLVASRCTIILNYNPIGP
jgi:hypothetical protein